jgi:hypothetical protein
LISFLRLPEFQPELRQFKKKKAENNAKQLVSVLGDGDKGTKPL